MPESGSQMGSSAGCAVAQPCSGYLRSDKIAANGVQADVGKGWMRRMGAGRSTGTGTRYVIHGRQSEETFAFRSRARAEVPPPTPRNLPCLYNMKVVGVLVGLSSPAALHVSSSYLPMTTSAALLSTFQPSDNLNHGIHQWRNIHAPKEP